VLPEATLLLESRELWSRCLNILALLRAPTFAMSLAAVLRELQLAEPQRELPQVVFERWKLSTDELTGASRLLRDEPLIRTARAQPWPKLQRVLIAPRTDELLGYCEAVAQPLGGRDAETEFC